MMDVLQQARRRALHHWVEDGLADLYAGLLLVLFVGIRFLARWAQGRNPALETAGEIGSILFLLAGTLLGRPLINALKQRITLPRTGYVAYHPPSRQERLKSLLFTLGLALAIVVLALIPTEAPFLLRLWGLHLVFFTLAFVIALEVRNQRFWGYSLVILVLALGYSLTWERWTPSVHELMTYGDLTFFILGGLMVIGGTWALVRYLQRYPLEEMES